MEKTSLQQKKEELAKEEARLLEVDEQIKALEAEPEATTETKSETIINPEHQAREQEIERLQNIIKEIKEKEKKLLATNTEIKEEGRKFKISKINDEIIHIIYGKPREEVTYKDEVQKFGEGRNGLWVLENLDTMSTGELEAIHYTVALSHAGFTVRLQNPEDVFRIIKNAGKTAREYLWSSLGDMMARFTLIHPDGTPVKTDLNFRECGELLLKKSKKYQEEIWNTFLKQDPTRLPGFKERQEELEELATVRIAAKEAIKKIQEGSEEDFSEIKLEAEPEATTETRSETIPEPVEEKKSASEVILKPEEEKPSKKKPIPVREGMPTGPVAMEEKAVKLTKKEETASEPTLPIIEEKPKDDEVKKIATDIQDLFAGQKERRAIKKLEELIATTTQELMEIDEELAQIRQEKDRTRTLEAKELEQKRREEIEEL
ncbi:hypothetical protein COU49_01355 [Candidatus Nomurabacteria bacterium CG10_big_fil_rev_8_21_14_0_10_35_16]|uniref:Uncharacterized protein n=1 Tax=Candidatus Nomurabacteria bacterium CG10_big_fil_rev_8_21_14_0_10_35_16 TaxID=1974731 RepID=A0A2H0TBF8_9BACT|nr:MAG: hypothetical protein COU49_01355 [Candidatus Nomurabacteria bacterium CG10_big_fil_rev_8_21_14_0_10_35_16]